MSARPIGTLLRSLLAQCDMLAGIQSLLNACTSAADRKAMIMEARAWHMISGDDATLLLQAYQLETA
jgi:hypothetical protein